MHNFSKLCFPESLHTPENQRFRDSGDLATCRLTSCRPQLPADDIEGLNREIEKWMVEPPRTTPLPHL